MKLLITGGCGFLGSNLAAHALAQGWELTVFDNLSRQGSQLNLAWLQGQGSFHFVEADIRDDRAVEKVVREVQPGAVFHLAGQVAMTTSIANPRLDFQTNTQGSLNVLEAVRQWAPAAAVLFSSTNKVYGDLLQFNYRETPTRYECIEKPGGFDEQTPLDFHSPYGCSKGAADQYMLDYARIFGLQTVVFRHSSMYGGRQFATYDQGWVGWFCQQAAEKQGGRAKSPFTISGSGKQVRDVLHAEDMIRLYFGALEKIESIAGNVFNIGGGYENSLSLLELFAMLEKIAEVSLEYTRLPPRESDQLVFVADTSKAKGLLGWQPLVSALAGVTNAFQWIQECPEQGF